MNSGFVRQRRRFSQAAHVKAVSVVLTKAEFVTFYAFWRDTLGQGGAWFMGPVWHNGVDYVLKPCQMVDGTYSDEPVGTEHVRASFQLRVIGL